MVLKELSITDIDSIVSIALDEDIGNGDITTKAVIHKNIKIALVMISRQDIILAGLPLAVEAFRRVAPNAQFLANVTDGTSLKAGDIIASLKGPAAEILSGERTALNMVQTLSGIATYTRSYVERIQGTGVVLLDTRKTLPGLRSLSKYASLIGGATNHRMRLDDGVLIKDNHIAVVGSAGEATRLAKHRGLKNIEVECDTLEQVKEALDAGADSLLLDNMALDLLTKTVDWVGHRIPIEASGGVNLDNIRAIAETGVDYISVGAITQSAPAVDIGLDLDT
jgi:nicotinate-nucleotide pyrophosphorylase (carboxylating)